LELCDAHAAENTLVVASEGIDSDLQTMTVIALERIGCQVFHVSPSLHTRDMFDHPTIAEAMKRAEFVVDLTGLLHESPSQKEHLKNVRVLILNFGNISDLNHLVVSSGVGRRARTLHQLAESSQAFVLTSDMGTHLSIDLSNAYCDDDTGIVTQPGEVSKWPAGIFRITPNPKATKGEILITPGDMILEARHIITTPVRLEIHKGHVVEILGESNDANLIRTQLESQSQPNLAYGIDNVSLGLNFVRGDKGTNLFDHTRLGLGQGQYTAGWCSVSVGTAVTVILTNTSATFDSQTVIDHGELCGNMQPDLYEKTAAGLSY
jgi:hypothetical protein